jgi:predicted ATPase
MMRLKNIALLPERIGNKNDYPFNIPAIASLNTLEIISRLCFFVGENGSGKSTLLEAVASHYGFGAEGGARNFFLPALRTVSMQSNPWPMPSASPSQNEPAPAST